MVILSSQQGRILYSQTDIWLKSHTKQRIP